MEQQVAINNKPSETSNSLISYKDEEKMMSESLHRNFDVLARFHKEPSAEFLSVLHPHMFVKPNTAAFFPVLHFLFTAIDATEFQKRFRWPILDRSGETNFRKAAVDYMNHLNVKHQLGMETLKLSNIHIPGGLKFIKIIHKFTCLAMKLEVNKPEHGTLPNSEHIPDGDDTLAKFEIHMEQGMNFVTKLDAKSAELSKEINEMEALMRSCFGNDTDEPGTKTMCWTCLINEWQDHLDSFVSNHIEPELKIVNLLSSHTASLKQLLTKLCVEKKENVVQYDKNQLMAAQDVLKKMHPNLQEFIDGIVQGSFIDIGNLFKTFSLVLPQIMNKLESFQPRNLDALEYEYNEIEQIDGTVTKYQSEYERLRELIQPFNERDLLNFKSFCENNFNSLSFNPMRTPAVPRRYLNETKMSKRLAISKALSKKSQLFKEPALAIPKSRNTTIRSVSSLSSFSTHKSKGAAIDLIGGQKKSRANSSQIRNMSMSCKFSTPKLSSTMIQPPTLNCPGNTRNRNNRQPELRFSPSFPNTPTSMLSQNYTETTTSMMSPTGISVIRKVSTSSTIHIRSPTRHFNSKKYSPELPIVMQMSADVNALENGNIRDEIQSITNGSGQDKIENENGNDDDRQAEGAMVASSLHSVEKIDEFTNEFIADVSDTVLLDVSSE